MSKKSETQKAKDRYCNLSMTLGVICVIGIVFSPTIVVTTIITAAGTGGGLLALGKIKKLNQDD